MEVDEATSIRGSFPFFDTTLRNGSWNRLALQDARSLRIMDP